MGFTVIQKWISAYILLAQFPTCYGISQNNATTVCYALIRKHIAMSDPLHLLSKIINDYTRLSISSSDNDQSIQSNQTVVYIPLMKL